MEAFLAILAVAGSLAGVALGRYLDRAGRSEEREEARSDELRSEAAEVLGEAKIVLGAMANQPRSLELDEIDKRRLEADRVRPRLMKLAVRWPDVANDLETIERFMAYVPHRLEMILGLAKAGRDEDRRHLSDYEDDQRTAVEALNRVIESVPHTTK